MNAGYIFQIFIRGKILGKKVKMFLVLPYFFGVGYSYKAITETPMLVLLT